jgi:hypothetical protein
MTPLSRFALLDKSLWRQGDGCGRAFTLLANDSESALVQFGH